MKVAVAGSGKYLEVILSYLEENNIIPEILIKKDNHIIDYKDLILKKEIDLLVCLAHPNILTKEEISLFKKGCINLHSGLPDYRGRHPVPTMLIDGLDELPVSVHFIDDGIDTGDIIVHDTILVSRDDVYDDVVENIINLSKLMIVSAIKQIQSNNYYRRKQHKSKLKYRKKRIKSDSLINWGKKSKKIHNFVNALSNLSNAYTHTISGKLIYFKKSTIGSNPGEVIAKTKDNEIIVSTINGIVMLHSDDFVNIGDKFK